MALFCLYKLLKILKLLTHLVILFVFVFFCFLELFMNKKFSFDVQRRGYVQPPPADDRHDDNAGIEAVFWLVYDYAVLISRLMKGVTAARYCVVTVY